MKKIVHKKLNSLVIDKDVASKYIKLCKQLEKIESELKPLEKQLKEELIKTLDLIGKTDFSSNGISGKIINAYIKNQLDTTNLKRNDFDIYNKYLKQVEIKENIKLEVE